MVVAKNEESEVAQKRKGKGYFSRISKAEMQEIARRGANKRWELERARRGKRPGPARHHVRLARAVRLARLRSGMTQRGLADALNLPAGNGFAGAQLISRIELGTQYRVSKPLVLRIAKVLNARLPVRGLYDPDKRKARDQKPKVARRARPHQTTWGTSRHSSLADALILIGEALSRIARDVRSRR